MKQKAEPVTSSFNVQTQSEKILQKYLKKATIFVVVIVALLVAVTILIEHIDNNKTRANLCSKYIIGQAYIHMSLNQTSDLASNVSTIKGLEHYQHDPNCMYIVTVYDIHSFNVSDAQASLAQFNKDYNGKNLSPLLANYESPANLKALVDSLDNTQQQNLENTRSLAPKQPIRKSQ